MNDKKKWNGIEKSFLFYYARSLALVGDFVIVSIFSNLMHEQYNCAHRFIAQKSFSKWKLSTLSTSGFFVLESMEPYNGKWWQ